MAVDLDDIREWGRNNGWDVEDGKRLPTGLRAAYDGRDSSEAVTTSAWHDEHPGLVWPDPEEVTEEIAPVIREATRTEQSKSFVDKIRKAMPAAPAKPRGRKPAKPRMSVEKLIGYGWRFLAQAVQPINLPVARILDMQAPVAGMLIEDAVKGTVVDRLLQPLARVSKGGELAFALLGPPMLVAAITQRPQMYPVLRPVLRESMKTWIDVAGEKLEEEAKKEQEFKDTYGTRIDEMIDAIFSPPEGTS